MSALEKLLERWREEGGISDEFEPLEKAILAYYLWSEERGYDCEAKEAAEQYVQLLEAGFLKLTVTLRSPLPATNANR